MRTRVLAVALALCVFALVAAFIWATVRTLDPRDTVADQSVPTAEVSEVLRMVGSTSRSMRSETGMSASRSSSHRMPMPSNLLP